jgi:tyrosine-protein phosphatase SIW14
MSSNSGLFTPPPGFELVEVGVYRSATPTEESLHFLQTLKCKRVVFLSPEALPKHFQDFVTAHGIAVSHLGLKMWQEGPAWKAVSDDLVKESLEMVLDVAHHPVRVGATSD